MHPYNSVATRFAHMTVAQFRAFKRAYAVLIRAGILPDNAVNILLDALEERYRRAS